METKRGVAKIYDYQGNLFLVVPQNEEGMFSPFYAIKPSGRFLRPTSGKPNLSGKKPIKEKTLSEDTLNQIKETIEEGL